MDISQDSSTGLHLAFVHLDQERLSGRASPSLLDVAERERARKFLHAADRNRFIAGRILIRKLLASHLSLSPSDVPLLLDNGRPYLDEAEFDTARIPAFNLSHSGEIVALAWSFCDAVGLDVERCSAFNDMDQVAQRVMNADEFDRYRILGNDEKEIAFFRLWVSKEAILKQLKTGFSIEPDQLHIGIETESPDFTEVEQMQSGQFLASRGRYQDRQFHLLGGVIGQLAPQMNWCLSTSEPVALDELCFHQVQTVAAE